MAAAMESLRPAREQAQARKPDPDRKVPCPQVSSQTINILLVAEAPQVRQISTSSYP